MELRPYQKDALEAVVEAVRRQPDVLLQAATGAGKTIMFSALVQRFIQQYRMRIVILAHREQLVRQAYDKLLHVWPGGLGMVGLACASVSSSVEMRKPVIIGSVQTLASRMKDMPEVHMLIVDECHRMPPRRPKCKDLNQYEKLILGLRQLYPSMRLLGVTATPYRMGHGYIYGQSGRKDAENWFSELTYEIGIDTLQDEGYLCQLAAYGAASPDLSGVKKEHGEFCLSELGEKMSEGIQLQSAVKAFERYASDRKHVVIFAVTIEHAEMLKAEFANAGYGCSLIHSRMSHSARMKALEDFDSGRSRFILNVGVLTEGWDCPRTDCILLCRPTQSTALYVQMIGRGLRLAEGKKDCLLLDLSGNWERHGSPIHPKVRKGSEPLDMTACPECRRLNRAGRLKCAFCGAFLDPETQGAEPAYCPQCQAEISPRAIVCPDCNAPLKKVRNEAPEMKKLDARNSEPVTAEILGADLNFGFVSKAGNRMARVTMDCVAQGEEIPFTVSLYLDLEGQASGWGQEKAQRTWVELTGRRPPRTLAEAEERKGELRFPPSVTVRMKNGFWNVLRWNHGNAYPA